MDLRNGSTIADFLNEALDFALFPDAPPSTLTDAVACAPKNGALSWARRQVGLALGDTEWATLPSPASLLWHFGRPLRRISRCRRPLYLSADAIGPPP